MTKKISVVLPSFNRAHTLKRALDSVVAQTLPASEIILVDDGSNDQTIDTVETWQLSSAFNGEFKFLRSENRGVSHARNLGARHAQGDVLAFLDSDDEWLPEKLERQIPLLESFQIVHGEEIWLRHGQKINQHKKHQKSGGRIFKRCVDLCCVSPSTVVINKDLFERMDGFREDFPVCEDYELWLRLSARLPFGFVSEPVLHKYGGHDDQLSTRFKAMDFYRARALVPFLESVEISEEERLHVVKTLIAKCEILIQGYIRHNNLNDLGIVQTWAARALSADKAVQIAHSVADRFPRSELKGTL